MPARCVLLHVGCPWPLGSCAPVCPLGPLCVQSPWPLGSCSPVSAWCVVLRVRCPSPLGCCSPVRPIGVLCCLWDVLSHLAPVHRCARLGCCVACVVSWATWLLFTGVPASCALLRVWCPWPLSSCSPMPPFSVLHCLLDDRGHLAPIHGCARSVCCAVCAVSLANWLLFTDVPARCAVCAVSLAA